MSQIVWRWVNLDDFIHVMGECPSCKPRRCAVCLIGARHYRPMHGGYADPCENCNTDDWSQGPAPEHDEIGMAKTEVEK